MYNKINIYDEFAKQYLVCTVTCPELLAFVEDAGFITKFYTFGGFEMFRNECWKQ